MVDFVDIEQLKKDTKIMIYGSYLDKLLTILEEIKTKLIENAIPNVHLIKDLVKIDENVSYEQKMSQLFEKIEEFLKIYDFNIFVFFEDLEEKPVNSSVIVELTTLLNSHDFELKCKRTLVLMPKNMNISMLTGIITSKKVNIFKYFDIFEISDYILDFVLNNI